MLGQIEFQLDAGEHDAREYAGNQNAGEQARENQEQQVVAGVDRGENQDEDRREVDHAVARETVINLIGHPAQAGAPRQGRNDRDGHPSRDCERNQSRDCSKPDAAFLSRGRRKKRHEESHRERQHGDAEIAPAGAVALIPTSGYEGSPHPQLFALEVKAWGFNPTKSGHFFPGFSPG